MRLSGSERDREMQAVKVDVRAPGTPVARWEHFPHGADVGVRGYGPTMAAAFEQVALALTAVVTDPASVSPVSVVDISAEAPDPDFLLLDWLNALVFEMATRGMVFAAFAVSIDDKRLTATARGERVSRERHAPAVEVKGATLTELRVARDEEGLWLAQCVVDV